MLTGAALRLRIMLMLASSLLLSSFFSQAAAAYNLNPPFCIITGANALIGDCIASAVPLWVIGIMLSFSLVALAYMLGEVFQLSSLKGWYRNELWETVKTMLLVAAIFAVLVIFSSIASSLAGTGSAPSSLGFSGQVSQNLGGLYYVAGNYLNVSSAYAENSLTIMFGAASGVDFIKSFHYSVWFPYPPIPTLPPAGTVNAHFGSTGPLLISNIIDSDYTTSSSSLLSNAATLVVLPSLIVLQMLADLFTQIVELGFGLFIPVGVVFRAIPFLRSFGGTFIALGIGVSLVFPMLFVVLNVPVSDFVLGQQIYCGGTVQTQCTSQTITAQQAQSSWGGIIGQAFIGAIEAIGGLITNTFSTSPGFSIGYDAAMSTFVSTSIYPVADLVTSVILNSVLQFVLLIIDFIIGYTIIKDVAAALGGTIRLGFGKMKLA